jgi:hypothetical protein
VCGHTSSPATLLGGRNMDEKRSEMRAREERMAEGGWAGRVHGVGKQFRPRTPATSNGDI